MAKKKRQHVAWTSFEPAGPIELTGNADIDTRETWKNSRYQVFIYRHKFEGLPFPVVQLSIKRNDRDPIHDWRELQRIKNELCGTICEASELYPNEGRHTDLANQYHLWCLPPGVMFPFGFDDGRIVSSDPKVKAQAEQAVKDIGVKGQSKQRGFEEHHTAEGCEIVGPIWYDYCRELEAAAAAQK